MLQSGSMESKKDQQHIDSQITSLQEHLSTIHQHLEKVIAENKRLREVVRLAESELRKRRDRVQSLELVLESFQNDPTQKTTNGESDHGIS